MEEDANISKEEARQEASDLMLSKDKSLFAIRSISVVEGEVATKADEIIIIEKPWYLVFNDLSIDIHP